MSSFYAVLGLVEYVEDGKPKLSRNLLCDNSMPRGGHPSATLPELGRPSCQMRSAGRKSRWLEKSHVPVRGWQFMARKVPPEGREFVCTANCSCQNLCKHVQMSATSLQHFGNFRNYGRWSLCQSTLLQLPKEAPKWFQLHCSNCISSVPCGCNLNKSSQDIGDVLPCRFSG